MSEESKMETKKERFPMTTDEQKICLALANLRFLPGSFDKRLAQSLGAQASMSQLITEGQREWAYRLLYKYRKQLPGLYSLHKNHEHCKPKNATG